MLVIESIEQLRAHIRSLKSQGQTIGLVPTMGNLHAGHLSLVELARQRVDKVVVSIFVNPLQFGPNEDFDRYPRTFSDDCRQLENLAVDVVFAPSVAEMYPHGQQQTQVCVPGHLTNLLEGASRPGHFDGVTTVVSKLFNLVQPDVAVFGQKDFQQWRVLFQMVADLAMPVEMIRAPIARSETGLALSSRNQYLTSGQLAAAPALYQILCQISKKIKAGEKGYRVLENDATQQLLSAGFDAVDYIKIVSSDSLLPATSRDNSLVVLAVAKMGKTRLLDNLLIDINSK